MRRPFPWVSALLLGALILAVPALVPDDAPEPRLVGYGCEGAGQWPLYAEEESDFPRCARIIPNPGA